MRLVKIGKNVYMLRKICFRSYCNVTASSKQRKQVTFSGIQPSGALHLGNYFGAIKQWVDIQNLLNSSTIYSIVDLHAITLSHDSTNLRKRNLELAASLIACGIDPDKSILFNQSMVPEHCELAWILGCLTTMARLGHLPQYKEKSQALKEIPLGLFTYPVLQSADILLYRATNVPVGEDQVQHVQLTQHLARIFNRKFGHCFPIPKESIGHYQSLPKLKSLRDHKKKMSKSDPDEKNAIYISDSPDIIREKLKKALTDFTSAVGYDPVNRPAVSNLITLHSQFSGKSPQEICEENQNIETAEYKLVLAEELIEYLKPIQARMKDLLNSPEYIVKVLVDGSVKAREIASSTMDDVKNKMGMLR